MLHILGLQPHLITLFTKLFTEYTRHLWVNGHPVYRTVPVHRVTSCLYARMVGPTDKSRQEPTIGQ